MNNEEKSQKSMKKEEEIRIDYEHIDVADIMDQIKQKIARKPKTAWQEFRRDVPPYVPSVHISEAPSETPGAKGKARGLLSKIMKPFSPLIKLLILPVYDEMRDTILILDQTNKRLDYLSSTINDVAQDFERTMEKTKEYTRLLHTLSHNIVVELSKLKIEEENLKLKTRIMEKDFEYLAKRERALEKHIVR